MRDPTSWHPAFSRSPTRTSSTTRAPTLPTPAARPGVRPMLTNPGITLAVEASGATAIPTARPLTTSWPPATPWSPKVSWKYRYSLKSRGFLRFFVFVKFFGGGFLRFLSNSFEGVLGLKENIRRSPIVVLYSIFIKSFLKIKNGFKNK